LFPPLTYLVDRLVVSGSITLLAGPPKAGKSLLALELAVAVAGGRHALNSLPVAKQGGVLYIALDDQSQARHQRRLRNILRGQPIPSALVLHTDPNLGRGREAARNLSEYLRHNPNTALVVIDTLEHVRDRHSQADFAYSADVQMMAILRTLIAQYPSVSLLLLTHTRKPSGDSEDPVTSVTGTHGVTGGGDSILVLSARRGSPRRILEIISRDGEDDRLALNFSGGGFKVSDEDVDDPILELTESDLCVYNTVLEGGSSVTAKDLAHLGIPKIGNRLKALSDRGLLSRSSRGRYGVPEVKSRDSLDSRGGLER
jgi:hypothetical protein